MLLFSRVKSKSLWFPRLFVPGYPVQSIEGELLSGSGGGRREAGGKMSEKEN